MKKTPAQVFCEQWVVMLWRAMSATGKGYKRDSLRNTGVGDDRRKDKLKEKMPQWARRYRERYAGMPHRSSRAKAGA
jgi:hypothetical protein